MTGLTGLLYGGIEGRRSLHVAASGIGFTEDEVERIFELLPHLQLAAVPATEWRMIHSLYLFTPLGRSAYKSARIVWRGIEAIVEAIEKQR